MKFYVLKSDRHFSTRRSVINHIRKIYDSMEIAYLSENSIEHIPKCEFCQYNAAFISYFDGYNTRCNKKECISKNIQKYAALKGSRRKLKKLNYSNTKEALDFLQYVKDNIEYYRKNRLVSNIIEPFTNKYTGSLSLYKYITRIYNSTIFKTSTKCKFCDMIYEYDIINSSNINQYRCNSKSCRNLELHGYNNSDIVFDNSKDLSNYIIDNKLDYKNCRQFAKNSDVYDGILRYRGQLIHNCELSGWRVPICNKSSQLQLHCKKHGYDYKLYLKTYLPQYISICKQCNKESIISKSGAAKRKTNRKFCSNECSNKYRREHPKICTDETRKKLSDKLKEKIANGTFTPKITNTRTHWNAIILDIHGKIHKFRSSWEAVFWACNQHLEFETIRIPYIDENGKHHSYIADFYDRELSILYEIKPKDTWLSQHVKMQQAIKYCLNNNITFIWINEKNLLNYIDINSSIYEMVENKLQLTKVLNGITKNTHT